MFVFLVVSLAITYCSAVPSAYGSAGLGGGLALGGIGLGNGYGLGGGLATGLSLGVGNGLGLASPLGYASPGPLPAAIHSRRSYEVIPVQTAYEPAIPQVIDVEPIEQPVSVIFRTVSSPVLVQQHHTPGAPGQVESTRSEDEPHRVLHEVLRPVIQEVREVIQPYRRVTQEVRPVLEEVLTVVAKGDRLAKGGAIIADAGLANGLALDGGYGLGGGLGGGLAGGLGGGLALSGGKGYKAKKAA